MMINSIDLEAFLLLICGFASFNFNWWFLHRRDWRVANLMTPATCQCQKNNWYLQLPSCKKESQTVDVQDVIKVLDLEILVGGFNWNNLDSWAMIRCWYIFIWWRLLHLLTLKIHEKMMNVFSAKYRFSSKIVVSTNKILSSASIV